VNGGAGDPGVSIRTHFLDPDHTFVVCDGCFRGGVCLDPRPAFNFATQEVEEVGVSLTQGEAVDYAVENGWLSSETVDGDVRRARHLCPRCRLVVVA
jgi:hypothetical protein